MDCVMELSAGIEARREHNGFSVLPLTKGRSIMIRRESVIFARSNADGTSYMKTDHGDFHLAMDFGLLWDWYTGICEPCIQEKGTDNA